MQSDIWINCCKILNVRIPRKLLPLKLEQVSPIAFEPLAIPKKVTIQKLNTWDIFFTAQRIIVRHVDNEWKERISSRGGLLAACFYQCHASNFAVLYERCLDSQVHCHFPGISLLVVTVLVVVLAKTTGTDCHNYPCSLTSCFKSFLCGKASWGGKQVLQIVLKYLF